MAAALASIRTYLKDVIGLGNNADGTASANAIIDDLGVAHFGLGPTPPKIHIFCVESIWFMLVVVLRVI